jgi:tetratricopeptide (TPR) repeat protein
MRVAVAVVGILATTALADPQRTVAQWLAAGRMYEGKGLHNDAMHAFTEGLKLAPEDVTLNAELGLAAYGAKKYEIAETATRMAIAHADVPKYHHDPAGKARGAALYNLGLIFEAQGRMPEATATYAESLQARSSRVVREKLGKLDAQLGALRDPLAPTRMPGPYATVREACRDALKRAQQDPDSNWGDHRTCTDPEIWKLGGKPQLAPPFQALTVFQMDDRSELDFAVEVDGTWYFGRLPGRASRAPGHCGGTTFHVPVAMVVGGQLRFSYTSSADACEHGAMGHDRTWGWDERGVFAIAVGPLGVPSITPPIVTELVEWDQYDDQKKSTLVDLALTPTWTKAGVDLAGKLERPAKRPLGPDDDDPEDLLGRHLLAFP